MAPELYEDCDADTRYNNKAEVYSFGITLLFFNTEINNVFSMEDIASSSIPDVPDSIVSWVCELNHQF